MLSVPSVVKFSLIFSPQWLAILKRLPWMKRNRSVSNSLSGKVVIITGASSGIGAGAARLLAEQGCKLALAARSVDKLEALAAELPCESAWSSAPI